MEKKAECRTCVFFGTRQGVGKIGNCRRYPKQLGIDKGVRIWEFPPMKPTEICGEYKRHPDLIKAIQKYSSPGDF